MLTPTFKNKIPLANAGKSHPCVSIIMPFDPKMVDKAELAYSLKIATGNISRELHENYDDDLTDEVLNKLENVIEHLDYTTYKKSIAIYVSPVIEKVYYLNIPVTEKIMVDTSFEIRDIVLSKKDEHQFLLLAISAKKEKIFVGNCERLTPVIHNRIDHITRDFPEPVGNFTDAKEIKKINLVKFLRYIDNSLSSILKNYPLPLFILTSKKTMGYFKEITKHQKDIVGFLHGNFDDATESDLQNALEPLIQNWKSIKKKDIINKLEAAENKHRLAVGIYDVWKQANLKQGQLLVVEQDFYCSAFVGKNGEILFCNNGKNDDKLIAKDAVDDTIEKVLQSGGDIEFVDELKDYNRIALVEYYSEN